MEKGGSCNTNVYYQPANHAGDYSFCWRNLSEVAGQDPDVTIYPIVVRGWPAEVLLNAAEGADLLVVGSRGRGGFTSALLGSVSQNCAHHATCPLLIIRTAKDHH